MNPCCRLPNACGCSPCTLPVPSCCSQLRRCARPPPPPNPTPSPHSADPALTEEQQEALKNGKGKLPPRLHAHADMDVLSKSHWGPACLLPGGASSLERLAEVQQRIMPRCLCRQARHFILRLLPALTCSAAPPPASPRNPPLSPAAILFNRVGDVGLEIAPGKDSENLDEIIEDVGNIW